MSLFKKEYSNCAEVCIKLFRKESIIVNKQTVANELQNHPYQNSLLSITDLLNNYGIITQAFILKNVNELDAIENPFIAQVSLNDNKYFCLVYEITNEHIIWYNPLSLKKEKIGKSYFFKIHAGPILLYCVDKKVNEEDYSHKKIAYMAKEIIDNIPFLSIVILFLLLLISFFTQKLTNITHILYIIGLLLGVSISYAMVRYENGYDNFLSKKLCHIGSKVDCSAVLHSKASNIFGVEWSKIGFAYFAGIFVMTIVNCENEYVFNLAAYINMVALPYIVYSLYTQIFKVKKICLMCTTIIVVLLFLLALSITGDLIHFEVLEFINAFLVFVFCSIITLWGINTCIELSNKETKIKNDKAFIDKIKYNKDVFLSLLKQGDKVEDIPSNITINIGNPNGDTHILKVCSPYCTYCSKSHEELEKIIDSPDVYFQILFAPRQPLDNPTNEPIKLFLALQEEHDEDFIHDVLKEWYGQKDKDYESFREKYTISETLIEQQGHKLELLMDWCTKNKIEYTPTFFINGHHLPDDYYSYTDFPFLFA